MALVSPEEGKRRHGAESASTSSAAEEFAAAFSHLTDASTQLAAALTPRQEAALSALRAARHLKPKTHWNFSELPDASEDELAMVTQLHQRLQHAGVLASPEAVAYCSDTTLLRYVRAHEHQLDTAQRMLTATLTWRAAAKPWALVNEATLTNKRATNGRLLGLDHKGRVVVYSSLKHIDERGPAEVKQHVTILMEKASRCISAGCPILSVIWFNHFSSGHPNGFGFRDMSISGVHSFISTFRDHCPEVLQTMVVVDPPSMFLSLWRTLQPVLAERTKQKAAFLTTKEDNTAYLTGLVGPDMAAVVGRLLLEDAK